MSITDAVPGVDAVVDASHRYFVDSTEADQGAATATGDRTIKDHVDAIGTTKKATLYFLHDFDADTTTYTITTSETIPSNVTLDIENGAILDGAGTLTVNGPFKAGLYQVFGSPVVIVGLTTAYPEWWGVVGDGIVDDTANLQRAFNVGNVTISDGVYRVTKSGLEALPGYGLNPKNNSVLTFAGNAWIKLDASVDVRHIFGGGSISDVTIYNPKIDGNNSKCNGIGFSGANNVSIINPDIKNVTSGDQYIDSTVDLGGGRAITFQGSCSNIRIVNPNFLNCFTCIDVVGASSGKSKAISVSNITAENCNIIITSLGNDSTGLTSDPAEFSTAIIVVSGVSFKNCGSSIGLDNRINFSFVRQNSSGNAFPWMTPARTGTSFSDQDWLMDTYSVGDAEWSKGTSYNITDRVRYTNVGLDSSLFACDHASGLHIANVMGYNDAAYGKIGAIFRGLGKNCHINDVRVNIETKYIYRSGPTPILSVTTRDFERAQNIKLNDVINVGTTDYIIEADGPINVGNPLTPYYTEIQNSSIMETSNSGIVDSNLAAITAAENQVFIDIINHEKGGRISGFATQIAHRDISDINTSFVGGYKTMLVNGLHVKLASSNSQLKLERDGSNAGASEFYANATGMNVSTTFNLANAAWNGSLMQLASTRLWVDATGDLRIKTGSDPISDTDGTVVGSQN